VWTLLSKKRYASPSMLARKNCHDCGKLTPETKGEHTLTTSFGWRLRKGTDAAGATVLEWRCPVCWNKFKIAHRATSSSEIATEPPSRPRDPGEEPR
jgi:hypothetical protein